MTNSLERSCVSTSAHVNGSLWRESGINVLLQASQRQHMFFQPDQTNRCTVPVWKRKKKQHISLLVQLNKLINSRGHPTMASVAGQTTLADFFGGGSLLPVDLRFALAAIAPTDTQRPQWHPHVITRVHLYCKKKASTCRKWNSNENAKNLPAQLDMMEHWTVTAEDFLCIFPPCETFSADLANLATATSRPSLKSPKLVKIVEGMLELG